LLYLWLNDIAYEEKITAKIVSKIYLKSQNIWQKFGFFEKKNNYIFL